MTTNLIAGIETARTDGSSLLIFDSFTEATAAGTGSRSEIKGPRIGSEVELRVGKLTNLFCLSQSGYGIRTSVYN